MASRAHKYSAYEPAAFILALTSDSESNDAFSDESTLESSGSYDSDPYFPGMEVDEAQENDQRVCFKNYYFCFFLVHVLTLMLAVYSEQIKLWPS